MAKAYYNIPVDDEDTYIAVKVIAKNNGFGERGMGQQIKAWVAQSIATPVCDHPKLKTRIQRAPSATFLTPLVKGDAQLTLDAWYCPTCNRVYQATPIATNILRQSVAAETAKGNAADPYGQPIQTKTKKRRTQRLGKDF